jgi:hypothetical protein
MSMLLEVPVNDKEAPELMVKSLATAVVLTCGLLGVPELMVTFVEAVGTPPHQLEASFQFALLAPVHIPEAVTFTVKGEVVAEAHAPFCTLARYCVACVNAEVVKEVVVFEMVVQVVNGETELSQLVTEPLLPVSVSAEVEPEQIGVLPEIDPATVAAFTVTVVDDEVAVEQPPFCTTARNCVVCVSAPDVYVDAVLVMVVQVVNGDTELSQLITEPT